LGFGGTAWLVATRFARVSRDGRLWVWAGPTPSGAGSAAAVAAEAYSGRFARRRLAWGDSVRGATWSGCAFSARRPAEAAGAAWAARSAGTFEGELSGRLVFLELWTRCTEWWAICVGCSSSVFANGRDSRGGTGEVIEIFSILRRAGLREDAPFVDGGSEAALSCRRRAGLREDEAAPFVLGDVAAEPAASVEPAGLVRCTAAAAPAGLVETLIVCMALSHCW